MKSLKTITFSPLFGLRNSALTFLRTPPKSTSADFPATSTTIPTRARHIPTNLTFVGHSLKVAGKIVLCFGSRGIRGDDAAFRVCERLKGKVEGITFKKCESPIDI